MLQVSSLDGNLIRTEKYGNEITVQLFNTISSGVYVLTIFENGRVVSNKKIVKLWGTVNTISQFYFYALSM